LKNHDIVEKNIGLMSVLVLVAISFGGLVQIVPQFFLKETTEPIEGLKPAMLYRNRICQPSRGYSMRS